MYLSTKEIAKDLGLAKITIQKYCQTGFIPSKLELIKGNWIYLVESNDYHSWKFKHFSGLKRGQIKKSSSRQKEPTKIQIESFVDEWMDWCSTGKLTGKPASKRLLEIYRYYIGLFFQKLYKYPSKPIISSENLRFVLGSFTPERFSTKLNIYSSLMSFSKFLIETNRLDPSVRENFKKLRPKRFFPAKKTTLTESQIKLLIQAIPTNNNLLYDRVLMKTMIIFLVNTGLRASEFCNLKISDIDLETGIIFVKLGKGNKNRTVGINKATLSAVREYIEVRHLSSDFENLFLNRQGKPLTVNRLNKKISSLAYKIGLKNISPHSFRRAFVTINAGKGKPLNHLRIACGHTDITTTQSYCMTSADEVVDAMKEW